MPGVGERFARVVGYVAHLVYMWKLLWGYTTETVIKLLWLIGTSSTCETSQCLHCHILFCFLFRNFQQTSEHTAEVTYKQHDI